MPAHLSKCLYVNLRPPYAIKNQQKERNAPSSGCLKRVLYGIRVLLEQFLESNIVIKWRRLFLVVWRGDSPGPGPIWDISAVDLPLTKYILILTLKLPTSILAWPTLNTELNMEIEMEPLSLVREENLILSWCQTGEYHQVVVIVSMGDMITT